MGKLGKDAKDLLVGNDGSEKEPKDFKSELQDAIKGNVVTKSDGTLLIGARMNTDKFGEKIVKKQEDGVRKIKDTELYDSLEEELEAKKEKEEKERKRREKEAEVARKMQEAEKENNTKQIDVDQKDIGEK